ncbi:MAG: DUF924 domain-containing protein [Roseomonas sp.]|nr:DUF924 domain-containing protein [Roseomonas sp.]
MNDAEAILAFWFAEGRDASRPIWFQKNDSFDAEIRERFGALIRPAREGAFDSWAETPEGALALLILLDQFPRNVLRGSAEAFASDAHARAIARAAVLEKRFDLKLGSFEKPFVYLPFEHSESLADQDLSVALFEGLRDIPHHAQENGAIDYAWRHRVVIQRFGRFPHRNAALGRVSSPAEQAWLDAGGGF